MAAPPTTSRVKRARCAPVLLALCLLAPCLLPGAKAADVRYWPAHAWGDKDGRGEPDGAIRAFQYLLRARGYRIAPDGVYGRATERAVRQFQAAHHLIASGAANTPTWEALVVPLKPGSRGDAVRAAQIRLRAEGYAVPVDGLFGPQTQAAVRRFQVETNHTADGLVGPYTWNALIKYVEDGGSD